MSSSYDAILIVSFGGPEGMDDVLPFLANVTRGKNVPAERLQEVAHHYELFGGVSPLNAANRQIVAALEKELKQNGPDLPVYWGNRNWHPFLAETLSQMSGDGVRNVLAFVTSAYSSYSGCRQYLDDIARAQQASGTSDLLRVDKIRAFYNHPLFVEANEECLNQVLDSIPEPRRAKLHLAFTAHSIPESMAGGCKYFDQLQELSNLLAERSGIRNWKLVFQSRSGPPAIPWLSPDILEHIHSLDKMDVRELVVHPIGFVSDHMEVIYDLDHEARALSAELGINMHRCKTAGTNPKFIRLIRSLVCERLEENAERSFLGTMGAVPDSCPADCCPPAQTRPRDASNTSKEQIPS